MPKTYTISDKQFTLSPVTPKRLAAYCAVLGITDAKQFKESGFISELGIISFNLSISVEKCNEMLAACLLEDVSGIDAGDIPVETIDQISNDFFSQRFGNLLKLMLAAQAMTNETIPAPPIPSALPNTSAD